MMRRNADTLRVTIKAQNVENTSLRDEVSRLTEELAAMQSDHAETLKRCQLLNGQEARIEDELVEAWEIWPELDDNLLLDADVKRLVEIAKTATAELAAVKMERDGLAAWVDIQPHANQCSSRTSHLVNGSDEFVPHPCDCWKARMNPAAILAARDLRVKAQGRAEGLREAAEHLRESAYGMSISTETYERADLQINRCRVEADELDRMAAQEKGGDPK